MGLMVEVNKLEYQEEDAKRLDNQIREDQENLQQQKSNAKKPDDESVGANIEDNNSKEGMVDEPKVEEEDGETIDGCEADSLDSAIDPEEHKAQDVDVEDGE